MIQRIQSLYLLLACGLMTSVYNFKLATLFNPDGVWNYYVWGIETAGQDMTVSINTWPVLIIMALAALMPLIAIFGYKNRRNQIKTTALAIMLTLLFYPIAFLFWWFAKGTIEADSTTFGPILLFPLMAIILDVMAIRAINNDERLVRSADRIR